MCRIATLEWPDWVHKSSELFACTQKNGVVSYWITRCATNWMLKKEMGMTEIVRSNGEKLHCNYRHLFLEGY
jgi:hypothetical protein